MSSFVQLVGLVVISVAVGLWSVPAGILTAGVCLVLVGVALERGKGVNDARPPV